MDFKLEDINGVIKVIQNMSISALPLVLAFATPLFYIAFKKLSIITDYSSKNFIDKIVEAIQLPKVEKWVLGFSAFMFVLGCTTVKIEQNKIERLRQLGWGIKNYFIENNIYCQDIKSIEKVFYNADSSTLVKLTNYFSEEFVLTPPAYNALNDDKGDDSLLTKEKFTFLYLVDDKISKEIIGRNIKLLDAYLSNNSILKTNSYLFFYQLKKDNPVFTYRVAKELAILKPEKFEITNQEDTSDGQKRKFGIAKK